MQKEFDDWFYDFYGPFSFRIEHFYEDCEVEDVKLRREYLKRWVIAAFQGGYERGKNSLLEQQQKEKEIQEQENVKNYDLLKESVVKDYEEYWNSYSIDN
jgi:hypothetical protein